MPRSPARKPAPRVSRIYPSGGKGKPGTFTGGTRPCQLDGCSGVRYAVRWPSGQLTYPCSEGLILREDGHFQINGPG